MRHRRKSPAAIKAIDDLMKNLPGIRLLESPTSGIRSQVFDQGTIRLPAESASTIEAREIQRLSKSLSQKESIKPTNATNKYDSTGKSLADDPPPVKNWVQEEVPPMEGFDWMAHEKKIMAEVKLETGGDEFSNLAKGIAADLKKSGSSKLDGLDYPSTIKFLEETGRAPSLLKRLKNLEREIQQLQTETGQEISVDEVFSEAMDMFRIRK